MSDIAANAFYRIQRFSTDWHANSFAGSTVRKVTRGMWALDLLNDTLLLALFPSIIMLIGSTVLMAWYWPVMGIIVGLGSTAVRCRYSADVTWLCCSNGKSCQSLGHKAWRCIGRCG